MTRRRDPGPAMSPMPRADAAGEVVDAGIAGGMGVVFSGMPGRIRDSCAAAWGAVASCRADAVLDIASMPDTRTVVFYQSPWRACLEGPCIDPAADADGLRRWLADWLDYHAAVVEAQRNAPARLLLVNAACATDAETLRARLADAGVVLPAPSTGGLHFDAADAPDWAIGLLAGHLAEHAPELWECYEALESCALLTSAVPELRATASMVDVTDPASLLSVVGAARRERELIAAEARSAHALRDAAEARVGELDASLQALRQENEMLMAQGVAQAEFESAMPDPAHADLREENEMLGLQVDQLHAELEALRSENDQARDVMQRATALAERARLALARLATVRRRA